jgi:2-polyprenyl-6-methoxyphenol hydroxylase-like FAD-dependent oxidoreductase
VQAERDVKHANILVIGGGIGGLTAAIALRQRGFGVDVIERDPHMTVYGVGIIQQGNVVRAVAALGILDDYIHAGFGFDHVSVFAPDGTRVAKIPSPRLLEGYPANVGISRRALRDVLVARARAAGAQIYQGVTANTLEDEGRTVTVRFSGALAPKEYDLVVGADGLHSATRARIFPDAPRPEFTGQGVWRYNFVRSPEVDGIHAYMGRVGAGLVPLSNDLMYMFVTTAEGANSHYPSAGLAKHMRSKLSGSAPAIQALAHDITEDGSVVYRPLDWAFLTGAWHRGRIVLLGDAVHATTPHLGQGAGMAIEDSLVLADELTKAGSPEEAFQQYRDRRFERCRFIVESSKALCYGQIGKGPPVDHAQATQEMYEVISAPI